MRYIHVSKCKGFCRSTANSIHLSDDNRNAYHCKTATYNLFSKPYLHVQQGEVKGIVEEPSRLDTEIKKLIGIVDTSAHTLEQDEATAKVIQNITDIKAFFRQRNEHGALINNTRTLHKELAQYEDYIRTITTEQNQGRILAYRQNNACLDYLKSRTLTLDKLKESLVEYGSELNHLIEEVTTLSLEVADDAALTAFVDKYDDVFELRDKQDSPDENQRVLVVKKCFTEQQRYDLLQMLGGGLKPEIDVLFMKARFLNSTIAYVDFAEQQAQVDELKRANAASVQELQERNRSISKEFLKENITEDVSTLLSKVTQYQTSIDQIQQRIRAIRVKTDQLSDGYKTLFGIADRIQDEWKSQEEDVKEKWRQLKSVEDKQPSPARQLVPFQFNEFYFAGFVCCGT